jgi:hypothetical protein
VGAPYKPENKAKEKNKRVPIGYPHSHQAKGGGQLCPVAGTAPILTETQLSTPATASLHLSCPLLSFLPLCSLLRYSREPLLSTCSPVAKVTFHRPDHTWLLIRPKEPKVPTLLKAEASSDHGPQDPHPLPSAPLAAIPAFRRPASWPLPSCTLAHSPLHAQRPCRLPPGVMLQNHCPQQGLPCTQSLRCTRPCPAFPRAPHCLLPLSSLLPLLRHRVLLLFYRLSPTSSQGPAEARHRLLRATGLHWS